MVAGAAGIEHVQITSDSTAEDYLMRLFGRCYIGVSIREQMDAQDVVECEVIRGGTAGLLDSAPQRGR